VEDLSARLADNPSALVSFVTTEHFNLQTARATTISETTGRASLFLGTVSGALVALAFIGQVSRAGTAFFVFGLVLFPALLFLGLATFDRVLQSSIEDIAYAQRINRIRRFYLEAAPGLAGWLAPAAEGDGAAAAIRAGGMRAGPWQMLLTIAGTIGVINSVIVGVLAALVVTLAARDALAVAAAVGVAAFLAGVALHQRHQRRRRVAAPSPFDRPGL
jgi:hypothetical protein